MAAHQAPSSLGFSRQEYWSGLPFPSPMHESESEVFQSCLTLHDPMDCSLPGSSAHGFSRQEYWSGLPFPSPFKWKKGCRVRRCLRDAILRAAEKGCLKVFPLLGRLQTQKHWAVEGGLIKGQCVYRKLPWPSSLNSDLPKQFTSKHTILSECFQINPFRHKNESNNETGHLP